MTAYFILTAIIIIQYYIISVIIKKRANLVFLIIVCIELSLIAGLRSVSVGRDSVIYYNLYYYVLNLGGFSFIKTHMEIGFLTYVKLLTSLFNSHLSLFLITAFVIVASNMRIIYKYSKMPLLSVLIYISAVSIGYYVLSLSFLRIAIALVFIFFAFDCILKRKPLKFTLLIFAAMLFHKSAFFFLILYPLSKIKLKVYHMFIITAISVIVAFSAEYIVGILPFGLNTYSFYLSYDPMSLLHLSYFTLVLKIFLVFIVFAFVFSLTRRYLQSNIFLNTLCWAMFLALMVEIISLRIIFINRIIYFAAFNILAIPAAIECVTNRNKKIMLIFSVLLILLVNNIQFFLNRADREHVLYYESYFANPTETPNWIKEGY